MGAKKKVLVLGPAYPYRGGIADTQNYLAQSLMELGHEVFVFTFKFQYSDEVSNETYLGLAASDFKQSKFI